MKNQEGEPNVYDIEFTKALEKFTKELEEKGLRWVTRNYSIPDKEYRVSVRSDTTEKFTDTYGGGKSFEQAFRNAIDNFEKKITDSEMKDIKDNYIKRDKSAADIPEKEIGEFDTKNNSKIIKPN